MKPYQAKQYLAEVLQKTWGFFPIELTRKRNTKQLSKVKQRREHELVLHQKEPEPVSASSAEFESAFDGMPNLWCGQELSRESVLLKVG